MPRIVDKPERRAMVASVAFDLVADIGIGAVTFRQVAEATGSSTAIVTNYFRDKNDLLFEVYRIANQRAMDRLEEAFAAGGDLLDVVTRVLPDTAEMQRNWHVWMAFWGLSHSDPVFREETAANARASVELYREMLARRHADKAPLPDETLEWMAIRLIATVGGAGMQGCLSPEDWPLSRLREIIAAEIEVLDALA
ncbi:MAG: TetR/AcrR family transcriptional regulator [Sphingomonadales bacterium]|nr:TetR/AcrR family transcriptional regulator [Sphingomonadales bacterium]MDE2568956.1 TetR/AcrR family transcriptional regulator [Sphingomonadales bacterium]